MKQQTKWGLKAFTVQNEEGATRIILVKGRTLWMLDTLMAAGALGVTPIDNPAPRQSGYVHVLRHVYGLDIETIHEPHGGDFRGTHARYLLKSKVTCSDEVRA